MMTIADLRPGDIGFGPIKGGAGLLVNAGQLMLGEGFHVGALDIRHVFVVTAASEHHEGATLYDGEDDRYMPIDDAPGPLNSYVEAERAGYLVYRTGVITKPRAVEAMPNGAREVGLMADRWTPEYAYVRLPEDYPGQAEDAATIARAMIGTPYSFASYLALAAWRFGIKTPRLEKWINRRRPVEMFASHHPMDGGALKGRMLPCEAICSVLADQAWSLTGKKIMQNVAHQCVTPGALAGRLLTMPGAQWIWPGVS